MSIEEGHTPLPPPSPDEISAWRRILRTSVRVLLVVLLAILLGIGLYYGIPYFANQYVQPVRDNAANLSYLATQQSRDMAGLQAQLQSAQTRIAALENERVTQESAVIGLQTRLQDAQGTLADHTQALGRLDAMQAELDQINQQLGLSSQSMSSLGQQLSGGQDALAALQQDVQLLKAMELLSRARLYLSQGNYGFARADLLAAHDVLVALPAGSLALQGISAQDMATRLDEAAGRLPQLPVLALSELDGVWEQLLAGLPGSSAPASAAGLPLTPTPTPYPKPSPTPCMGVGCPTTTPFYLYQTPTACSGTGCPTGTPFPPPPTPTTKPT